MGFWLLPLDDPSGGVIAKSASDSGAASDASAMVVAPKTPSSTGPFGVPVDPYTLDPFDVALATEAASVQITTSGVQKTGTDSGAATDASSVGASTPTAKTGADSGAASETADVVEITPPAAPTPGRYDLQLGRIKLPSLLERLKETVGDQLDVVGAAVTAGERRARAFPLEIPLHSDRGSSDSVLLGDRMRRQIRALLENPAARQGALYLRFPIDPELSGWLLIGGGDLAYGQGGVTVSDYVLQLQDCYRVAAWRSHLDARRVEVQDRRLPDTPRDARGEIFGSDFAAAAASVVAWVPVSNGYVRRGKALTGNDVSDGIAARLDSLADGDVIALRPGFTETDTQVIDQQAGDVLILDTRGITATAITQARDLTPQDSYGWEEVYGPAHEISAGGRAKLLVANGRCRAGVYSSGGAEPMRLWIERMTASGYQPLATIDVLSGALTAQNILDVTVVSWTPDEAIVRWTIAMGGSNGAGQLYVTLKRGWNAPRVEIYDPAASAGQPCGLQLLPVAPGAATLRDSGATVSPIVDATDYGVFTGLEPWFQLTPPGGTHALIAAVAREKVRTYGRVESGLQGVRMWAEAPASVRYASVQLAIEPVGGTLAAASTEHGKRSLMNVRTVPTLVPR